MRGRYSKVIALLLSAILCFGDAAPVFAAEMAGLPEDAESFEVIAEEMLLEENEIPAVGTTDAEEEAAEVETNESVLVEEDELEHVYQFGDAPTEREAAVYAAEGNSTDGLEEYLYAQMQARNTEIDISSYGISYDDAGKTQLRNIFSGILNEHPDLYFVGKKYTYGHTDQSIVKVVFTYNDSLNDEDFQLGVDKALAVVDEGMSPLEKAIVLHDYLAVNCAYDKERLANGTIPNTSYNAYGVLVDRTAVCEGYALAYKYLLSRVGIDCYMVTSMTMNHAWNLVKLGEAYYQVDITWDDPTWDLTGRACHTFMLRSDDAFETMESKHENWSVTEGSYIVDYKAADTQYDNAFWIDSKAPLVLAEGGCYYVSSDRKIKKASLAALSEAGEEICDVGIWEIWDGSGTWQGAYSGLFLNGDRLYYNDPASIYSISLDGSDKRTEFTADTSEGYIYGTACYQGKVWYSLRQTPNLEQAETVLDAGIDLREEKPSVVPVEEIILDKTSLTLDEGDTAVLSASVIPADATERTITWFSSDPLIATVEAGTVTAAAAGECEITASAGGKSAVCRVTVNQKVIPVQSVTIDKTSVALKPGNTVQLNASISPENATDPGIFWSSSDKTVATVDENGMVTAVKEGSCAIVAAADHKRTACIIQVNEAGISGLIDSGAIESENGKIEWEIDSEGKLTVTGTGDILQGTSYERIPWYWHREKILSAEINLSGMTSMYSFFRLCRNMASVKFINFDTKNVTNMSYMFMGCSSLETLDITGWDTQNVTDMGSMFMTCSSLKTLDITGWDTQNVTNMGNMFSNCSSLETLDVSGLNTGKVTDMSFMFSSCRSLTDLDISHFNTENVTKMDYMFFYCSNLTTVNVGDLNTQNVVSMRSMFSICENLQALDVSGLETENVTNMAEMFHSCRGLTALNISGLNTENVTNMRYMFEYCHSLTTLDVSGFKTSNVTNMGAMFDGCSSLTALDISNFDTGNVTDMDYIFEGCSTLKTLNIDNLKTENVTNMAGMFCDCKGLTALDVSKLKTGNVTNMTSMFSGCDHLASLDLSGFDTGNVTSMSCMFWNCDRLASLDLSGFDTKNVTNMSYMFNGCDRLVSLNLGGFDTGNVTYMFDMFRDCGNLAELDLSNFDTKNVTDMSGMFAGCVNLTELDLSNFDLTNLSADPQEMFSGCSNLARIKTPVNINVSVAVPPVSEEDAWYHEDGTVITEFPKGLDRSVTLTKDKKPEVVYYTVTFDLQEKGTALPEHGSYTIEEGSKITKPSDPSADGYTFMGWYKEASCVTPWDFDVDTIEADTTLYACWKENEKEPEKITYSVLFHLQGIGTALPEYSGYTEIEKGSKIAKPSDPSADGYTFMGWYKEASCVAPWDFDVDTIEADTTLYACWKENEKEPEKITYSVLFNLQGIGTALPEYDSYTGLEKGSKVTKPSDPTADGYIFMGWYKEAACMTPWDFDADTVEEDVVLYARWKQIYGEIGDVLLEDIPDDGRIPEGLWAVSVEKDMPYTGKAVKPKIRVYWNNEQLDEILDYKVKYKNNTKVNTLSGTVGAPAVIITGKKHCAGTYTVYFNITPVDLTDVTADDLASVYNGKIQKKIPALSWNGKKLANKKDFTVSYPNENESGAYREAGEYEIFVEAKQGGNFKGTKTISFSIVNPQEYTLISKAKVGKIPSQPYSGTPIELNENQLKVTLKGVGTLVENKDYTVSYENNTEVGTASVILQGMKEAGYIGTKRVTFKITGKSLKKTSVTGLAIQNKIYNGKEQEQDLSQMRVTVEGKTLSEESDYEVFYSPHKNAGKVTLYIQGINGYTGTVKKTYKITAYNLKDDPDGQVGGLEEEITMEATAGGCRPKPLLTFGGRRLIEGRDYSISYKNNKKPGAAGDPKAPTIVIKGKGNFKGTVKREFTIV